MTIFDDAYAERWPTVAELERELYGRQGRPPRRNPKPTAPGEMKCHHCNHPDGCKCGCEWGRL